jgi:glutamate dehydrogenase (NADP+)
VAHFAHAMLTDQQDTLVGKRCLILGSGKTALYLADKLLEFGAIPVAFSDASGCVYEPGGFGTGGLRTIHKIKSERGALLGRYIIHSTTAEFLPGPHTNDYLHIPCDICFPCEIDGHDKLDKAAIAKLADHGCSAVIEGNHATVTADGRAMLRQLGLHYGPHVMTLTGSAIVHQSNVTTDEALAAKCHDIYQQVKSTASEFNARGDLLVGANILGFYRIANVMMTHGAV